VYFCIIKGFVPQRVRICDFRNMNEQELYIPYEELQEVSTGSTQGVYFVKTPDGNVLHLQFVGGRLDEASVQIKQTADEAVQHTIELLEKKLIDEEVKGIEDEAVAADDETKQPFDPSSIKIEKRVVTMDAIIRRLEQNTIKLNPGFQRKEVWDDMRKCQLIESLLLRIPIPMFYVSADSNDHWTVVDGLQRLSTIRDFVLGPKYLASKETEDKGHGFKLFGLEFCGTQLNHHDMAELPTLYSNRIMETEFTFTIINPGTPEDVKRNIFKRINTGGIQLSPQEIRNALYGGECSKLLNELADMRCFKDATGWSVKSLRMEDKELVLRFVAFLLRDFTKYSKSVSVDTWLGDTMMIYNAMPGLNNRDIKKLVREGNVVIGDVQVMTEDSIKIAFEKAMMRGIQLFGLHAFRKSLPGNRRSPINKSLFETWGVLLSKLSDSEFANVLRDKEHLLAEYESHLYDNDFIVAISRDSMNKWSVGYRYRIVSELINAYK